MTKLGLGDWALKQPIRIVLDILQYDVEMNEKANPKTKAVNINKKMTYQEALRMAKGGE